MLTRSKSTGQRPSVDLDVVVLDPDDEVVASSDSFDDNNEIVDCTTKKAGTYKIRALRVGSRDYSPSSVGVAWYNRA